VESIEKKIRVFEFTEELTYGYVRVRKAVQGFPQHTLAMM